MKVEIIQISPNTTEEEIRKMIDEFTKDKNIYFINYFPDKIEIYYE